jgi:hypothetical protein
LLFDFAEKSTLHRDPKVTVVLTASSRRSPSLLDEIFVSDQAPELAVFFPTSSSTQSSRGTTEASSSFNPEPPPVRSSYSGDPLEP